MVVALTMTIPVLPSIVAGQIVTAEDLNAIGTAVTFIMNKPLSYIKQITGGQALSSSGTYITFGSTSVQVDTDGMYNNSNDDRLTIQTPGWYKVRYAVTLKDTSNTPCNAAVYGTTGSNNPLGSGVTSSPYWASYCALFPGSARGGGVWPFYLYAGDYVRIKVFAASGDSTLETNIDDVESNAGMGSYLSLEYVGCSP